MVELEIGQIVGLNIISFLFGFCFCFLLAMLKIVNVSPFSTNNEKGGGND